MTNETDTDADLCFTAFFADREPTIANDVRISARRNRHLRTDSAELAALGILRGEPYGLRIESEVRVEVQYSRLDESSRHVTLMTTTVPPVLRP